MKASNKFAVIAASLLLGAFTTLTGCATTGMQRSEKTGNTMQAVEQDIRQALLQVDVTSTSLEELVRPGQPDVKKAFNIYSDNVAKMEHQGKTLFEHADKMNAQGRNYFQEWQKQGDAYANPEIQSLSEQRRSEMSAAYAKIAEASVGVKGAARAYLSNIKEIQVYLSNDLTPKGIDTIAPVARRAASDGDNLKSAATPVLTAIGNARAELAHGDRK
jgi:hypothetical protein